jgi:hypothetical protein
VLLVPATPAVLLVLVSDVLLLHPALAAMQHSPATAQEVRRFMARV